MNRLLFFLLFVGIITPPLSSQTSIGDPRDLPGNVVWLDGSDPDGNFQSGGNFSGGNTWVDKSTSGNAQATQTMAFRRPTVLPNALNGLSGIHFDGNDYMDVASAAFSMLSNKAGATLFVVASTEATSSQRLFMISTDNSMRTRAGLNMFDGFGTSIGGTGDYGAAGRRLDSDPFQRIEGGGITLNQFDFYAGGFDYATGELSLWVHGNLETWVNTFQTPGITSPSPSLNIRVGADANLNNIHGNFNGTLAEIIVYNRLLPDAERQAVEAWLESKWFISSPWSNLGGGLAGTHGVPSLTGDGSLQGGTSITLSLDDALEMSQAYLVIGFSTLQAPFKGGVLIPTPDILIPSLPTGPFGSLLLGGIWPGGLPAGLTLAFQTWVADNAGPSGFSATPGLGATTP